MAFRRSRVAARLRRGWGPRRDRKPVVEAPPAERVEPPARRDPAPLAALRGLGERPATAPPADQAAEAELDTLRGELVRELDRMAEGDDGSGSFRRIAS
jgi:hypothetical protein